MFHDLLGRETYYILDFYCAEARFAIELDGPIHLRQEKQDMARTQVLHLLGIFVLRFRNQTVEENMPQVLKLIQKGVDRLVGEE